MKSDKLYLRHIDEAIESIEEYLRGVSYSRFISSKMMIDAVVRELEIIGEASKNLSDDFREKHSDVFWR